jgi:uncharacterized protein YutD
MSMLRKSLKVKAEAFPTGSVTLQRTVNFKVTNRISTLQNYISEEYDTIGLIVFFILPSHKSVNKKFSYHRANEIVNGSMQVSVRPETA